MQAVIGHNAECVSAPLRSTVALPSAGCRYKSLRKPWFTPPDFVFGIAWTVLYLLMGVAAYRVYKKVGWPSWALQVNQLMLSSFLGSQPERLNSARQCFTTAKALPDPYCCTNTIVAS